MAGTTAKSTAPPEVVQPPAHLEALLDYLLHPAKNIDDAETIDWCRWLVGGGRSPDDFSQTGERLEMYSTKV